MGEAELTKRSMGRWDGPDDVDGPNAMDEGPATTVEWAPTVAGEMGAAHKGFAVTAAD